MMLKTDNIWRQQLLTLILIFFIVKTKGLAVRNEYNDRFLNKPLHYNEYATNDLYSLSTDLEEDVDGNANVNQEEILKGRFDFLMPNVNPDQAELYLCTPIKVDFTRSYYITGYEPNATMNTAHHMILYGCGQPGSSESVWNCGEMARRSSGPTAAPCNGKSDSEILYAWARDAPALHLPKGVGFKVGKDSPIKYMVLQVHYSHVEKFKNGKTDDSGVFIDYTTEHLNKLAGVLLMGTAGQIQPKSIEHMETACQIAEPKVLHPFAYRTHTHSLGKVVSGYKVRTDDDGVDHWTLLGKRDPLTPQMFYPIMNNETIIKGDSIAARCTMHSNRNRITEVGATGEDEMCNFYLMYYVENGDPLTMKHCFSQGPPYFYWNNPELNFNNIPDVEASTL